MFKFKFISVLAFSLCFLSARGDQLIQQDTVRCLPNDIDSFQLIKYFTHLADTLLSDSSEWKANGFYTLLLDETSSNQLNINFSTKSNNTFTMQSNETLVKKSLFNRYIKLGYVGASLIVGGLLVKPIDHNFQSLRNGLPPPILRMLSMIISNIFQ